MNRLTSLMTLSVFALTLAIGLPAMADEHKGEKDKGHDGEKHKMMDGKMHKKHMKHMEHMKKKWKDKGHDERGWHGDRGWKDDKRKKWGDRDDWKDKRWKKDRDDRWKDDDDRYGDRDDYREDDKKKKKHSIHRLYKKAKHHLDLSDERKQELSNLYFETKLTLVDYKAEKKKRHLELKQLKHSEDPSRAEVMDKIDELYEAKAALKQTKVGFKMDMKDQLGSEMWKKLTKKDHDRHQKHGDRGHDDHEKMDEGEKSSE
jgi:hypothetical protein